MKDIKKKRAQLAVLLSRKVWKKYNDYVRADDIVKRIHGRLYNNRDMLAGVFTKHVRTPLLKITEDGGESKKYVISFFRRLSAYYGNSMIQKKKSVARNGRVGTEYSYALVKP